VVESACHTKIVSSVAACPVYSVVLSPDRALVQYEVLSATVQSAVLQNERVPIVVTLNATVQSAVLQNERVPTVVTPNATVQTVVILNETAQTSGFRNAMVQTVLVQSVGIRHVMVVRRYRAVMVLMVAHCEVPPSVAVVHCVARAPRYVAVGARCEELQLWQATHYAEERHSSESEPSFAAPVELVQCVRELALASHLSLNSQVVRHDLASIRRYSKLPTLWVPAVLRLQLDFEFPGRRDLHRDQSSHAVSAQAG
jgi:hypothetical protein